MEQDKQRINLMVLAQSNPVFTELIDFLASTPTSDEILAYKPSEELEERLGFLLEKNRRDRLSSEEQAELEEFLRFNHFVNMLKIRTQQKLVKP
jgi:hypothetical protein